MRADQFAYFPTGAPIAMAHRGGTLYPPNVGFENSLAAFSRAIELGYSYLETDVHATADGVPVAFHDDRLDRVTDANGLIDDLPYAQVAEARIGGRESVPTLSEVFEAFPTARINIDIKSDAAVNPTVATIRAHAAQDRVCVGSFSSRRLRAARSLLGPAVATAAGPRGVATLRLAPKGVGARAHSPAPVFQVPARHRVAGRIVTVVTPAFVARAHALGKHVHVWFHSWDPETPERVEELLDLGVDGIVTDHPRWVAEIFSRRGLRLGGSAA